jgi:hypothetical protein
MVKNKKTAEEIAQEQEAAQRKADEDEHGGKGKTPLTPGLIQENPPNPAEDFASIMLTYHVPQGDVEAIIKYLNDTGSDNVYFDVPELIGKLMKFPRQVAPVIRRQVMDHWIAINKIIPPEDYDKIVETIPEEYRKVTGKEKYTVDDVGNILVASNDANALTYSEAEKLAERRKKDNKTSENKPGPKYVYDPDTKAVRMARDGEQGGTMEEAKELKRMADESNKKEAESPFMQTEDGQWALVPGARLSTLEMMTWQSMQKAAAAGQLVDPITAMIDSAEKFKSIRDLFGGGGGIPDWMKDPVQFRKMMAPENSGDNEAVKALTAEVQKLREDQHATELRQRDEQLKNLTTKAESDKTELLQKIEDLKRDQHTTGSGAIDVIRDGFNKLPDKSDIKSMFHDVVTNPPALPRMPPTDRSKVLEVAADKLETAGEVKKVADALFNLS